MKIKTEIEINLDTIGHIICNGIEGGVYGIAGWASIEDYRNEIEHVGTPLYDSKEWPAATTPNYITYALSEGCTVVLRDNESDRPRLVRLNLANIERGLKVMAKKYRRHFDNIVNDNADAITGDVLIQCAVFGDLIYG